MSSLQKLTSNPMAILKIAIALCYLALGVYLYMNSELLAFIDITYRHLLAWVFIAYGAFRLVRSVIDLRND